MTYQAPCDWTIADRFRCPSKIELFGQIMKLLPRGRAWQTHEDVRDVFQRRLGSAEHGAYELGGALGLGAEAWLDRLTGLQRYWLAFAEVLEHVHERACRLVEEMFCETAAELRAEWGRDYGFPDACEPWDTLCDKVRAQGGATCAYLASLAAKVGYTAECVECELDTMTAADCVTADCTATAAICPPSVIRIRIHVDRPPTVLPPPPRSDLAAADCTPLCDSGEPPIEPPAAVVCLIERFKPAHVKAIYEVI